MTVRSILADTIRWQAFEEEILYALGPDADAELEALIQRVEGKFRATRRFQHVLQFMRDHSKLRDAELVSLFEFMYSSLINNLKGELAELLARPRIRDFATLLDIRDVPTVLGPRLRERPKTRSRGWLKGADALLCNHTGGSAEIFAVVEVKAMEHPLPRIVEQLDGHVARMRSGGLQIDEGTVLPDAITVRYPDGQRHPLAMAADVPGLVVWPYRGTPDDTPAEQEERMTIRPHAERRNVWIAELLYKQDEITEAAYRLTDWFFARLGAEVFYRPGDAANGRKAAPHPEDSLEENGRNAFRAALFGVWQREIFQPRGEDASPGGKRTPGDTFLWLYNSICGNYKKGTPDDIYFPDFEPNEAYEARRLQWVAAREAFARKAFDEALGLLPDPAQQTDLWMRRREWLLQARIAVFSGRRDLADTAMERAYAEAASTNLAVPLERAATHALVVAIAGDREAAKDHLRTARELLDHAQAEIALHVREGFDYPADIDRRSLESAIIDMATASTAIGDPTTARALVVGLEPLDPLDAARLQH